MSKMPIEKYGGAERDRTVDPLLAKQVLSQLSYSPLMITNMIVGIKVVGLGRFELPTSPLSGVRSNQLSYRPDSTAPDPQLISKEPDAQAALLLTPKNQESSSLERFRGHS